MCGIFALFKKQQGIGQKYKNGNLIVFRNRILELSRRIRHRGPDWNGIYLDISQNNLACLAHERLAIIDVISGSQPIISQDQNLVLTINGEIYNYQELKKFTQDGYQYQSNGDCEPILAIYQEWKTRQAKNINYSMKSMINLLDGIYSFILYDKEENAFLVARDPIGVTPLYYGISADNEIFFASEMKCLIDDCVTIKPFPPGHFMYSKNGLKLEKFCYPKWDKFSLSTPTSLSITSEAINDVSRNINELLTKAVHKRLMADVPYGVLLSGGLDSSLVSSIASRYIKEHGSLWGNRIHSFSIGLQGSPDLAAARKVASFIDSIHHEYIYTLQEGMDAIRDVIYHLETYDITTIRASTPMYLLSRKIKAMGIKMVLSGEGADEVFGGYLYFHHAPSAQDFHDECKTKVKDLHNFDCLRANKSTMAWGLEARVPFLDFEFLEYAMTIHPDLKCRSRQQGQRKIEKFILRNAFDVPSKPYLPDEILWRQKEQFSDGVGYSWIDSLIQNATEQITDVEFQNAEFIYPHNPPSTKEAYLYRKIFEEFYTGRSNTVAKWVPQTNWDNVDADPSGRAQTIHEQHSDW